MAQADTRFRTRCAQFRWLTWFMVGSVGLLLALLHIIAPLGLWLRGAAPDGGLSWLLVGWIHALPSVCYLFGVWSIGVALGRLSKGRLIQPTLASALRTVGLALGIGGVLSVFVVTYAATLISGGKGGYLHFDIPGMTLGMMTDFQASCLKPSTARIFSENGDEG